ncbi:MAG: ATP synthase subunit delta [bacterium ADurb.Bin429]|nr:MAG: ATP synthase subunit delta [bacterium ADurb.Bin429]
MLARRIAQRYTRALFSLAQEHGTVARWEGELATLTSVLAASPELPQVLAHPEIPLASKLAVLERVFAGKLAPEILALVRLLITRGHEPDMETIHAIYVEEWNAARRILPVEVVSAVPLSEAQAQALTEQLTRKTGATIRLERSVDPALIAGLVLRIGDRVIDASARGALDGLRDAMRGTPTYA